MKWCERCGGPRRPGGCRLCGLIGMTSQQVIWHEQERLNYTAEGEALGSVAVWATMSAPDFDPAPFHTPCPHASGWWLPEGARDRPWPPLRSTSDEAGLLDWLARYGWHAPVGERFVHVGGQWAP
jgi:hypothetical protein